MCTYPRSMEKSRNKIIILLPFYLGRRLLAAALLIEKILKNSPKQVRIVTSLTIIWGKQEGNQIFGVKVIMTRNVRFEHINNLSTEGANLPTILANFLLPLFILCYLPYHTTSGLLVLARVHVLYGQHFRTVPKRKEFETNAHFSQK